MGHSIMHNMLRYAIGLHRMIEYGRRHRETIYKNLYLLFLLCFYPPCFIHLSFGSVFLIFGIVLHSKTSFSINFFYSYLILILVVNFWIIIYFTFLIERSSWSTSCMPSITTWMLQVKVNYSIVSYYIIC